MNLCYIAGSYLYRKRRNKRSNSFIDRSKTYENYWKGQFQSSEALFFKLFDFYERIPDKDILDIGCGLGGRTSYLATRDVKSVVGIDINTDEIDLANRIAAKNLDKKSISIEKLQFIKTKEGENPRLKTFDIVILIDSLEHVKDPLEILNFAFEVLRPGGILYFTATGWYHYNGAHELGTLPIPFMTFFFRDASIIDAIKRIISSSYYTPSVWDSDPPIKRWIGVYTLNDRPGEYLNKITISGVRKAIRKSKFQRGEIKLVGFSWQQAPFLGFLNTFTRIPILQEAYHSICIGRLVRK